MTNSDSQIRAGVARPQPPCPECEKLHAENAQLTLKIAQVIEPLKAEVTYLARQRAADQLVIQEAIGALEFYGKKENHYSRTETAGCGCCSDVLESLVSDDDGAQARTALSKLKERFS